MLNHVDQSFPTNEEWVLYGILEFDADKWLEKANEGLASASDDPMPYALAALSVDDFTIPQARQIFDLIVQADGSPLKAYVSQHMDASLRPFYERLLALKEIGQLYAIRGLTHNAFLISVYIIRIDRLRSIRVGFEGVDVARARECAMAIASLNLAWEDLIE